MKYSEYKKLFDTSPCSNAQVWLESQPCLQDAWNTCYRGDWLWWALMHSNSGLTKDTCVEFARWCASRAKKHADAAYADAAAYAAADAAYAAATYADAAAYAAADADAAYAAAAYAAERKTQADWIREHIQYPFSK